MDSLTQQLDVYCKRNSNILEVRITFQGAIYEVNVVQSSTISLQPIMNALKDKQFTFAIEGKEMNIKISKGIINLKLQHCCSKHWFEVPDFNDVSILFKAYPFTHYEYAAYYLGTIFPVIINGWNRGWRITTKDTFPGGDNSKSMRPTRVMWTKGTDDEQSKGQKWYHQYVDENLKPFHSNGQMAIKLYAKKL